jgi:ribokinase
MDRAPKIAVIGLSGHSVFMAVEHFHRDQETLVCREIHEGPGGKGFNQAVAARRLGAEVSFLSAVGSDIYAGPCRERLAAEGIDARLMVKASRTATAVILTDSTGANRVTVYPGSALDDEDVLRFQECIQGSDILLLQLEVPAAVNEQAVRLANRYGVRVIVNPAPPLGLTKPILAGSWLLTPNRHEAESLDLGGGVRAVVTLGHEGALIVDGRKQRRVPPLPVKAVDTTGAGDVFTAALAVMTAKGHDLNRASRFACAAAGLSVTRPHVLYAIPYLREVDTVFCCRRPE